MIESKKWYLSLTLWAAFIQALIGILLLVADFLEKGSFTPVAYVLLGVAVLQFVLRLLTKQPLSW